MIRNVGNSNINFAGAPAVQSANSDTKAKVDLKQKSDSFVSSAKEFAKKNSKKIAIGAGILAAAGIAFLALRGKCGSNLIKFEASRMQKEGEKELNEVASILQKAQEGGFEEVKDSKRNVVIKFIQDEFEFTMRELKGEKILRETTFDPEDLEVSTICKGIRKTQQCEKIDKTFNFEKGEIISAIKGMTVQNDGTDGITKKYFNFSGGKLDALLKGIKRQNDNISFNKVFAFNNNKLAFLTNSSSHWLVF